MSAFGSGSLVVVTAAVAGAAAVAVLVGPRASGYLLALVLVAMAAARALLPARVTGPFAVRTRPVDAAVCLVLAAALAAVAYVAPM